MAEQNLSRTKVEILRCLSDGQWRTTPQVAQASGLSLTNVSELLRRYHGQGLVSRRRNYNVPRGYLYRITDVGFERLSYLNSNAVETSSTIADLAGLRGTKRRIFDRWVNQKLGR